VGRDIKQVTRVDENVDPTCYQFALTAKMGSDGPKPSGRSEPFEKVSSPGKVNPKIQGSLKP
jgi:hypothetical protein